MTARVTPLARRRGLLSVLLLAALASRAENAPTLELNLADRAELESLPGIGPQLAERLLIERERGYYRDWTDLRRRVRGLGPKLLHGLSQAGLRVDGQPYEALTPQVR